MLCPLPQVMDSSAGLAKSIITGTVILALINQSELVGDVAVPVSARQAVLF